ncbi:cornifelin homolog [Lissotriton helveticus]
MNVVHVNQPVPMTSTQVTVMSGNYWSSEICDCCEDCSVCCCAFWCCPCFQCQTVSEFGECLCLPLIDLLCIACTGYLTSSFTCFCIPCTPCPPISMAMRSGVRERYKIQGSIFDDCCMLCGCYCCSWCQMAREIKKRKQPFSIINAQTTTIQAPQSYSDGMAHKMPPPYSEGKAQAVQQHK